MRRILFLAAHPIEDASRRYRIEQFLPILERAGYACTVSEFTTPKLFRALHSKGRFFTKGVHAAYCGARRFLRLAKLSQFDLVVIHREVFPFLTPLLEKWVLKRHKKVIFSLDDAIYAAHPDSSRFHHPRLYRFKYGRSIDEALRASVHVIAGNYALAAYARRFNAEVTMIPTVVDCDRYQHKPVFASDGPVTIGWVGSKSTSAYVLPIADALRRLAAESRGKVRFRFIGDLDLDLGLPDCETRPFRLESELADLRSLDIGLMPMPDTTWTRGKCAFKAIQYMAMGIPTVASPVGATLDVIEHDRNGLLAESSNEWYYALERLIHDHRTRRRLSECARQTIDQRYSLRVWGPRFLSLMDKLCTGDVSRQSDSVESTVSEGAA